MKPHVVELINKDFRIDGRKLDDYRKIVITNDVSNKAEGSARVKMGDTEVIAGIKMNVGTPYPDSPDEGVLITSSEMLPLASSEFLGGPPGPDAIELARVVDRGIRESKMIDMKKMCVRKGELIWTLFLDIYPINDDGNLLDASMLAAVAALDNAVFPKLEDDKVLFGEFTKDKLPLVKKPLLCTIHKIGDKLVVDPCKSEERLSDARVSVAVAEKGEINAMQKGGTKGLSIKEIDEMISLAEKKSKELRKNLK